MMTKRRVIIWTIIFNLAWFGLGIVDCGRLAIVLRVLGTWISFKPN